MRAHEISKNIYSKYSLNDIKNRMRLLGKDNENEVLKFLNIRLITSILLFLMILYFVDWGYILGPIFIVLYYIFLPNITIDRKIKKRKAKMENEAMYFFEILVLSLESGNNLYNAIQVTSDNIDSELSNEFKEHGAGSILFTTTCRMTHSSGRRGSRMPEESTGPSGCMRRAKSRYIPRSIR